MADPDVERLLEQRLREIAREEIAKLQERRRWANIEQTADHLGLSVKQVRGLKERGLPAKRVGKRLVFDLRAVDAFLEELP